MKINFISTGDKFPYAYYIGVITAVRAYGSDVILWIVKEPKSPYFDLIKNKGICRIEQSPITEEDFMKMPTFQTLDDHMKLVTMFDYLAWKIITWRGGIIAGLDSITLKRWDDLLPKGKEMLVPRDIEHIKDTYAMHGVCVRPKSKIAQKIFWDINKVMQGEDIKGRFRSFKDGKLVWGGAGIIPYLNNVLGKKNIEIIDPGQVAGRNRDGKEFYLYQDKDTAGFMHKDVRTIPLYATSTPTFGSINESFVANSNTLYGELVKTLLPDEWNPLNVDTRKRFRFHVLGLVHLPTSEEYMACAFTQKNVKLCKMLMEMGHEVYLYGAEGSTARCTRLIVTHTLKDIRDAWGDGDNRYDIGYNWKDQQFRHDFNVEKKPVTLKYYQNAINEINKIKKPDDFLVITQGTYQRPIDQGVKLPLTVESGIGYRGSYARYRAWESSYIQNFTYGSEHPRASIEGHYYDRIIPNYFDPKDFPLVEKKDDYFLFMGRVIQRKGVYTAIKTCQITGDRLIIAGQLSDEIKPEDILKYKNVEFVGFADPKKRAELMGHAKAVFCPSTYLEPFCGVFAEANLCGTPVIATNFGAFTDYVVDGINGYKCDTLQDFVDATKKIDSISATEVRKYAERFTLESVSKLYQKWFKELYQWYLSTTNPSIKGWHYIENK